MMIFSGASSFYFTACWIRSLNAIAPLPLAGGKGWVVSTRTKFYCPGKIKGEI